MTSLELTGLIARILDSKKAQKIEAINIRDLTIIADYFIIAGGTSTTQVRALADEIEFKLKTEHSITPLRVEGYNSSSWILVDYGSVVVHIFLSETRDFYSLERLWTDGEHIALDDLLTPQGEDENEL